MLSDTDEEMSWKISILRAPHMNFLINVWFSRHTTQSSSVYVLLSVMCYTIIICISCISLYFASHHHVLHRKFFAANGISGFILTDTRALTSRKSWRIQYFSIHLILDLGCSTFWNLNCTWMSREHALVNLDISSPWYQYWTLGREWYLAEAAKLSSLQDIVP